MTLRGSDKDRGKFAGEEDHSDRRIICLKQDCVKTNASSGGTDATENEKAVVLKKPRRTVMINSILISMDVIMLQTVP